MPPKTVYNAFKKAKLTWKWKFNREILNLFNSISELLNILFSDIRIPKVHLWLLDRYGVFLRTESRVNFTTQACLTAGAWC